VVCPSTPYDAKGLLKAAIRDDNPVVFMESELQYNNTGEVPEEDYVIPMGVADIKRVGKDVTLIAWAKMVDIVLEAAVELEKIGINAEVVDPRTLRPLDIDTLATSVKKTGRCVIVEVGWPMCGVGGEIAYQLQRECLDFLDSPVERVCSEDVPMPYAKNLENEVMPQVHDVVRAVKQVLYLD
jgi:pyruvate dehydrogenase E1 component beta subunit